MKWKIYSLRLVHGIAALYFVGCMVYLYVAAALGLFSSLLMVAITSLAIEGFVVFVLNNGDCPLIHLQRKLSDDKPFFELFLPSHLAKRAIPIFAWLTWIGLGLVAVRFIFQVSSMH